MDSQLIESKMILELAEIVQLVKERQYTPKFSCPSTERALLCIRHDRHPSGAMM
jgi:hypothetical protein